jgi:uncharacterized membrane protein YdbT with pleckstrin-like domain
MGKYVQNTLLRDERLVFETYYHWMIYFWPIFFCVAAIPTIGITLIIGIPWLIRAWIARATSEFAITNKRVIIKVGWIRRKTIEMNISKVESVDVAQGIFARIFGWGKITVVGTGGSREPFSMIAKPMEFRRAVQHQETDEAPQIIRRS